MGDRDGKPAITREITSRPATNERHGAGLPKTTQSPGAALNCPRRGHGAAESSRAAAAGVSGQRRSGNRSGVAGNRRSTGNFRSGALKRKLQASVITELDRDLTDIRVKLELK